MSLGLAGPEGRKKRTMTERHFKMLQFQMEFSLGAACGWARRGLQTLGHFTENLCTMVCKMARFEKLGKLVLVSVLLKNCSRSFHLTLDLVA